MEKGDVLENIKSLGFTVKNISTFTGIPSGRIYQWYAKRGQPKQDDYKLLIDFYTRMKPKPTNDFHGKHPQNKETDENLNLAAEPEVLYELIKSQKKTIELLEHKVAELEDKLKPPLLKTKTGG